MLVAHITEAGETCTKKIISLPSHMMYTSTSTSITLLVRLDIECSLIWDNDLLSLEMYDLNYVFMSNFDHDRQIVVWMCKHIAETLLTCNERIKRGVNKWIVVVFCVNWIHFIIDMH